MPEDLLQRWEDYYFMFRFERFLNEAAQNGTYYDLVPVFLLSPRMLCVSQTEMSSLSPISPADCRQFLDQSPGFVSILQAGWLLHSYSLGDPRSLSSFYYIRLLLNLSWDDLLAAFSALRSLLGGATREQVVAASITILALSVELYPTSAGTLTSDLACGCLHVIQQIGTGDLPVLAL
jgi:hypothetical protein